MFSDSHIHSWFSGDSETDPEAMIKRAIYLNMETITFTEHLDLEFPQEELDFTLDIDEYTKNISELSSKYYSKIEILTGIESGLEPELKDKISNYIKGKPFDFIIGSSHVVNRMDPYSPEFFKKYTEREGFESYFKSIIENLKAGHDFDVYGHIDYIVRYAPNKNTNYSYFDYSDIIDEILKIIIEKDKGIEINTAGFKYGLNSPNPDINIIKKYHELGGEIITIGSDAHTPNHIGFYFNMIEPILLECGFRYYNIFKKRNPEFIKL